MGTHVISWGAILSVCLVLGEAGAVVAQVPPAPMPSAEPTEPAAAPSDILDMDVEQLAKVDVRVPAMEAEVTTVSRTAQPIGRTPAAVYVVTNEMIRRSGARNIPEVLRTVPGVQVARINASTWAITIRGFNGRFANKLLVQIDGVAVYSPLHSGVFWEREPVMLEDVERIEVIRGPGGTIWGNNAVNGIINIVTKSAQDTQGIYADVGGGNEHRQFTNVRAGGRSGDLAYRAWGSNMNDDTGYLSSSVGPPPPFGPPTPSESPADEYQYAQGGFRADWTPSRQDTVTFQGDFANGLSNTQGSITPMESLSTTGFRKTVFLGRWAHEVDVDTDWAAQVYYYNPYGNSSQILENTSNVDFDFQYHMLRDRHEIVWGCGYRNDNETLAFDMGLTGPGPGPMTAAHLDTERIPSYFLQDTITLVEDRLFATVGSKFDHNSITNFEYQPSVKLAWTPDERSSVWGAVTRAVRTPSLKERASEDTGPMAEPLRSEDLLSYEVGYRRQPTEKYFWEWTVFFNRYNDLIVAGGLNNANRNMADADAYGFEYNATYQVNPAWRLTGSYSFFIECLRVPAGYTSELESGANPRNQFYLQSGWDLGKNVTFDIMFRYVDSLLIGVDRYFVGDVRLAWRPRRNLEFSVVGQNLFDGRHYEFDDSMGPAATEVEPGVYGMVSWRY